MIRVTIWNEFRHEKKNPKVKEIYPEGIHNAIAAPLRKMTDQFSVQTATLDDPEHGLSEEVVSNTDVLVWWGHMAHAEAVDLVVERCYQRILKSGMGLVVLHSGHFSKIFKKLMGTTCDLKWRESNDREVLWVTRPGHPIVRDIDDHFIIDKEEMYGEYFDIPEPEETIMISSFTGGEVCRSLMTWTRGAGKIVYFRPGHETFPTYHDARVQQIIDNACKWAAPTRVIEDVKFGERKKGWLEGK